MTQEAIKSKFEELKMTQDEIDRFGEAMKKEEFRKLLVEYAEEISDPKNRELYEKEITMLEQERGQNVIFIHPEAGFCMKTTQNGNKKCFINICKNINIEKPTSKRQTREVNDKKSQGLVWYIPHTCSPPRDDLDKSGKEDCVVYDVVFNPDSYRMAETNERFKSLIKNSAMDTIESNFNVKLDRANVKVLKHLNFKGRPTATILRKAADPSAPQPTKQENNFSNDDLIKPLLDQIKENNLDKELAKKLESKTKKPNEPKEISDSPLYTTPNYKIVHRGLTDMADYAHDLSRYVASTRPKELVIDIELPLCKSSQNVILDVFETRLHLESKEPNYLLDLTLPFPVREKEARAKFDKSKRSLFVTIPVVPFVSKLDDDYIPSSPSSLSSTSSIESNVSSSLNQEVVEQKEEIKTEPPSLVKFNLPDQFEATESSKNIWFKFKIINYSKETILIDTNESCFEFKCESCGKCGSYVKYYSIYVKLDDSDVKLTNDKEINFIDDDYFEIKFTKMNDVTCQQAIICLDKKCLDNKQRIDIKLVQDKEVEEKVKSQAINMNKMSKKEFILNFKTNAENSNDLDEDDDDEINEPIAEEEEEEDEEIEETKLNKTKEENIIMKDKILEEPEYLNDSAEQAYLSKQSNQEDTEDEEDDDNEENKKEMSLSSSSTNFSNDSNSLANRLKSILKKPRSFSESENNLAGSFNQRLSFVSSDGNSNSESLNDMTSIKKSVSFNKQVVRNVFKPGSTVMGMRKPNSKKNQKKNKRKRTVSDPSFDSSSGKPDPDVAALRPRNLSESSDDNSSQLSSSSSVQFVLSDDEDLKQTEKNKEKLTTKEEKTDSASTNGKKKKNKKKKGKAINDENNNKIEEKAVKNPMTLETMISWKNEGRLPETENPNKTNCSFKFKNKLMNDLDD